MKNIRQSLKESTLANVPKVDHYCGEEDVVMADAKDESIKKEEEINKKFKPFDKYKKGFTGASDDKRPIKDDVTSKVTAKEELDESLFGRNGRTVTGSEIKKLVEDLINSGEGCVTIKLDNRLALCIGWSDGFDTKDTSVIHDKFNPSYAIVAGIKVGRLMICVPILIILTHLIMKMVKFGIMILVSPLMKIIIS